MRVEKFDGGISPDQQGEIVKQFVSVLAKRSHTEGQAMLENSSRWHFDELLNELGDFACDWVMSDIKYPRAYEGLRPIEEQVHMLADEFRMNRKPALELIEKGLPGVPEWAEGWAALPIQETFPHNHANIVYKALIWHSGICGNQPGCFASSGAPGGLTLEDHVRPHFVGKELEKVSCTRRNFAQNWKQYIGGRIMIVPVQMGAKRRGQSDRMVKAHCKRKGMSEFPLGIFEVACLLAMHPERVPNFDERALGVNAPGDEYTYESFCKWPGSEHFQMGEWSRSQKGRLPSFSFARNQRRNERNGPVTASGWDIRAHLREVGQ